MVQLNALVSQLPRQEFDVADGVVLISHANEYGTVEGHEVILVGVVWIRYERTEHGRCTLPQEFARLPNCDCKLLARHAFKRHEFPFQFYSLPLPTTTANTRQAQGTLPCLQRRVAYSACKVLIVNELEYGKRLDQTNSNGFKRLVSKQSRESRALKDRCSEIGHQVDRSTGCTQWSDLT